MKDDDEKWRETHSLTFFEGLCGIIWLTVVGAICLYMMIFAAFYGALRSTIEQIIKIVPEKEEEEVN